LVEHPICAEVSKHAQTDKENDKEYVTHQSRSDRNSKTKNNINEHRNKPSKEVRRSRKVGPLVLSNFGIPRAGRRNHLNELDSTIGAPDETWPVFGSAVRAEHLGAEFTTLERKWLSKVPRKLPESD
jgi:hypothetical protein